MKKRVTLFALAAMIALGVSAQQALFNPGQIISPEINSDNSVTFRLFAPEAREVKVSGDWLPAEGWTPGSVVMNRDEKGVWSHQTAVLPSELYSYSFIVDGVRCNDPSNVYQVRDVATVTSVFIVGGGRGSLYSVNNVPHGTVARRWYNSPGNGMMRRITVYTPAGYETGRNPEQGKLQVPYPEQVPREKG